MRAAAFIALALLADPILAASIHHGSLDNGLGVVIVEDHSTQLVGIHLAVKVSMQQEPAGLRGVRALIQRQIGTQIRSRAASDPALAPLNVSLHRTDAPAMVNLEWDFAEISLCVPASALPDTLKLLAEVVFREGCLGLDTGKNAVLTEQKQVAASGVQEAYYLFRAAMLGGGVDRQMILGDATTVGGISAQQFEAFKSRHYVPVNSTLCLAGAVSAQEGIAQVNQAFGGLPGGKPNNWHPSGPAVDHSQVRVGGGTDVDQAILIVGVAAPSIADPDFPAAFVAHQILGGPRGRLRRDLALIRSLGLTLPERVPGVLPPIRVLPLPIEAQPYIAIWSACNPLQIEKVHHRLATHLRAFIDGGINDQELQAARRQAATDLAIQLHIPQKCAAMINRCQLFSVPPEIVVSLPAAVQKVTSNQVKAMAARWFTHEYVGVQMPQ